MKKLSILFFSSAIFFLLAFSASANFIDVPADHKYKIDINYLENIGIVKEGYFKPDESITREEFAKWVLINAGFSKTSYTPLIKGKFLDVDLKKNPNAPYIYRLADIGVVKFEKDKINLFRPKDPIRKKQAIEWIFFVEGLPVPTVFDESQFFIKDINKKSHLAPLFFKAMKVGMFDVNEAKPIKVYPNNKLKRAQAAHFLRVVKTNVPTLTVTIMPSIESDIMKTPAFDTLVGVWNKIKDSYLKQDAVNRDKLIYGAAEGLVKELGDKHSNFERPGDNAVIESLSGQIEGIGAVIQMQDDEPVVVAPIKDSPADKAGIMANDVIVEVDGLKVKGMALTEIVSKIKGKKGTQVTLKIRRSEATFVSITVTRDVVKIVSVSSKRTADDIVIITMANFGENSTAEFQAVVDDIKKNGTKGIVLDLRNNPGGFLNTAVAITGFFLPKGEKVAVVKYPDSEDPQYSGGEAELKNYKIVAVVNGGSASASEILAGALQDKGLAKIVGEKTYGKGTVQELSDFADGSTLKLTVAEWLTPNGRSIEKDGIAPDIEVKMTSEDKKAGQDPQMDKALEELRK